MAGDTYRNQINLLRNLWAKLSCGPPRLTIIYCTLNNRAENKLFSSQYCTLTKHNFQMAAAFFFLTKSEQREFKKKQTSCQAGRDSIWMWITEFIWKNMTLFKQKIRTCTSALLNCNCDIALEKKFTIWSFSCSLTFLWQEAQNQNLGPQEQFLLDSCWASSTVPIVPLTTQTLAPQATTTAAH